MSTTPKSPAKKEQKSSGLVPKLLAATAVIVAVVLFCLQASEPSPVSSSVVTEASSSVDAEPSYPQKYPGYTVVDAVPRKEWAPTKPFAKELSKQATPVILSNTVATEWPALKKWSLDYLKQRTPDTINNVYQHTRARFGPLFRPKKPMASISSVVWGNPHNMIDMNSTEFFHRISSPKLAASSPRSQSRRVSPFDSIPVAEEYLYYTGDLNTPSLVADLQPMQEMLLTPERPSVNIWIGQAGVLTHTHLDTYDNFFVQIANRKTFLLFPPGQSANLHPYPFLHPSHGQAQADIDAADLGRFPRLADLECYIAELHPGDMLYIPPLWWHYVVALDTSVSVNVWSVSQQQDAFDSVINTIVRGVNHQWEQKTKRSAARFLLQRTTEMIARYVISKNSSVSGWEAEADPARTFVQRLFEERYAPLTASGELSDELPSKDFCKMALTNAHKNTLNKLAKTAAEAFRTVSPGNRDLWLGNLAESLAYWGNGDVSLAAPLLKHCF